MSKEEVSAHLFDFVEKKQSKYTQEELLRDENKHFWGDKDVCEFAESYHRYRRVKRLKYFLEWYNDNKSELAEYCTTDEEIVETYIKTKLNYKDRTKYVWLP